MKFIKTHHHAVHRLGAYEIIVHFFAFSIGIFFDYLYPISLLDTVYNSYFKIVSYVCFFFGSFLILYTRRSIAHVVKKAEQKEKQETGEEKIAGDFTHGPYRFFSHPTHIGLTCMISGFALINHAYGIVIFTILGGFFVEWYILPRMEKHLTCVHGICYFEYKTKTPSFVLFLKRIISYLVYLREKKEKRKIPALYSQEIANYKKH